MSESTVSFGSALERGYRRMVAQLFRPFRLEVWIALGFTAFLAALGRGGLGSGFNFNLPTGGFPSDSSSGGGSGGGGGGGFPELDTETTWLLGCFLALFLVLIAVGLVLMVLFLWLSSRGQFMFLDNVVHRRNLVKAPWAEFKTEGDALFVFRLVLSLLTLLVALAAMVPGGAAVGLSLAQEAYGAPLWAGVALLVIPLLIVGVLSAYVQLFLSDFVVPIMYRDRIGPMAAFNRFVPILRAHFWRLVLYGLLVLVLMMAVGIAVLILGVLTCCIGLLLVVIPYIGTVVLLPVPVTYRAFSLEVLGQLEPRYRLFPGEPPNPPPPAGGGGGPAQPEAGGGTGPGESPTEPTTPPPEPAPLEPGAGSSAADAPQDYAGDGWVEEATRPGVVWEPPPEPLDGDR